MSEAPPTDAPSIPPALSASQLVLRERVLPRGGGAPTAEPAWLAEVLDETRPTGAARAALEAVDVL